MTFAGGWAKEDEVRKVARIQCCISELNADKGEGVQNPKTFADIVCGWFLTLGVAPSINNEMCTFRAPKADD